MTPDIDDNRDNKEVATETAPKKPVEVDTKSEPSPEKSKDEILAPVAKGVETDASPVDAGFVGYPLRKFHPVYGAMSAKDPNEAYRMFMPAHDWFDTAEEADMHRTHTEALQVMHHNQRTKLDQKLAFVNGEDPAPSTGPDAPKGVVRNSVAAQESLDAGGAEPL